MLVLIGQIGSAIAEREAFQEIDYRRMYGPLAKWVAQVDRIERLPEFVSHALHTAVAGRPGPVVLVLPEDMLFDQAAVEDIARHLGVNAHPGPHAVDALVDLLESASRPLVVVGGSGWTTRARSQLQAWAQANALAVCAACRRQDLKYNDSAAYTGDMGIAINPDLARRVREADVLLAIAGRKSSGRRSSGRLKRQEFDGCEGPWYTRSLDGRSQRPALRRPSAAARQGLVDRGAWPTIGRASAFHTQGIG